jgi:hypothetical protein
MLAGMGTAGGADQVLITEFMAVNDGSLADEDGEFSDWIELHNAGSEAVDLDGWFLTDRASDLRQWRLPSTNLPPNGYLVVFASGKDRRVAGAPLHTNFRLGGGGEYLALVRPSGTNVASAFAPFFPSQVSGVSYGLPMQQTVTTLVPSGAVARVTVPWDESFGSAWQGPLFDDSWWPSLPTGVGFETDGRWPFIPMELANSVTGFSGRQGQGGWFYGYWNQGADPDGQYADSEFTAFPSGDEPFGPDSFWIGSKWDWFGGDPPFTEITRHGGWPSGNEGSESLPSHWAIRRYHCESNGPITIRGTLTHTSDWVYVTQTGVAANSLIYVYLSGTGEGYLDDLKLVAGTVPEAGPNLLPNGDFESGALTPWTVSANLAGSAITAAIRHSGSRSLRLVSTAAGTTRDSSIWQTISPALVNGQTYTLSYWYLPVTNSAPLVVRFSGNWIESQPRYCGDGVVGRIFVDGTPVYAQPAFVSRSDFQLTVPARRGSRVDFALDAGPRGDGACDGAIFTAEILTADPTLAVVADSAADWSRTGTQGEKNWHYGYFRGGVELPPIYRATNFVAFPRASGPHSTNNFWDGAAWDWWNGDPPFDEIGQVVMHPNGYNNNDIHWVIRRWISEVSGPITVDWTVNKLEASGAGVTLRILRNGIQQEAYTLPGTNAGLVARSVVIPGVQVGDFIDVALDPQGFAGGFGDGGDRCQVTAVIRGYPSLTSQIQGDIEFFMHQFGASVYLRLPFYVADPSAIQFLTLRMKYDDGFVAWLNGELVASANAPAAPEWNAAALTERTDAEASEPQEFNLTSRRGLVQPGWNVLAIQGLNASANDSDLLILPELLASSVRLDTNAQRYFAVPTPGAPNGYGQTNLGPLVLAAAHLPNVPQDADDLRVTAQVRPTFLPVSSVSLIYRVMFGSEVSVPMQDDGLHDDGAAGDGLFGGAIPAAASTPGQMVRYYVYATDLAGNGTRFPAFEDPQNSPAYQGTLVFNPALTNPLPVLHLFVQDPVQATNYTGTRASLFWDDEFYDNVGVNLHGQTTVSAFPKRSLDVDMNPGLGFRWSRTGPRLDDFDLMTTSPDKAHMRHVLAYEVFREAGVPAHIAFPVRLQQNGAFYGVMHLLDNGDAHYLRRAGLDPNGALYKVYLPLTNAYGGVAEKKTRKDEINADLEALIAGLNLGGTALRQYLYDNLDIPEAINYFATLQVVQNEDCCFYKNYYLYRDTEGTGEWQMLPWDLDLTFGRTFTAWIRVTNGADIFLTGGYYDTNIYWTNRWYTQARSTYDYIGIGHPLANALFSVPETYQMFLRRWGTVQEQFLQPSNTHPLALKFERRVEDLAAQLGPDAALDVAKWGPMNPPTFYPFQTLPQAVGVLKTQYFAPRRGWIFNTLAYTNGGPYLGPQPSNAVVSFGVIEFNPASGNQAQEFIQLTNPNPYAVDLSGWQLSGAVEFTFRGGTVIPATNVLYVSPNVNAFRARLSGPRGGQGLFVQGNYKGQLSARGEALQLTDATGRPVSATNYSGAPSPAQQYLRVTELMYHPEQPPPGLAVAADEFEYLELKNIGPAPLSLVGVRFTDGIQFTFTAGSPVTELGSGETVLLVRNVAAFVSRYGEGYRLVGPYLGALDNNGENLRLEDASGEKILEFRYDNKWYPVTDGLGFSLVIVDETAPWNTWDRKASWRPSGRMLGSPGQADPAPVAVAPVLVNEILTATAWPVLDALELYNPTPAPVPLGGWYISDDFAAPRKFRIPDNVWIPAGGYWTFDERDFNPTNPPLPTGFAFSSKGDEAYLFAADAGGELTGYYHGFAYGAAAPGVAFGRHVTSVGAEDCVAQSQNTLGAANAGPRVGPVVISELMYHPPDLPGGLDNTAEEFVELRNLSGEPVDLFDPIRPAHTWRLRGAVDLDLPGALTLAPGEFLLVVGFNPADAAQQTAFRTKYGVPAQVRILGPYGGKLDNSAERVRVFRPGIPEAGEVPYILVDEVSYADSPPWPPAADGSGASLQRRSDGLYGNDPVHWAAASPTAGRAFAGGLEPVIISQPAGTNVAASGTAVFTVQAGGAAPLRYQWRLNGATLWGATGAVLTLTNVQITQAGSYDVVVFNSGGTVFSSKAALGVVYGPYFTQQPRSIVAAPGANASFTAQAISSTPVRYQWRREGMDILGATGAVLTLTNVQAADVGTFSVLASDALVSLASAPATLALAIPPLIVQPPVSQTVVAGATVVLSVVVTNTAALPILYRWRTSIFDLPGGAYLLNEHTSYLTITNAQSTFRLYSVIVSNAVASNILSATATLTFLTDTDRDGLPDGWEDQFGFLSGDATDRNADADADRMSNWEEYVAGTDPTNALSYLKVEPVDPLAPAAFRFVAVSNRTYTVQFTDDLAAGPWLKLADLPAHATNRTVTVAEPEYRSSRFYRLITPRQR